MKVALDHIHLKCQDLATAAEYYQQIFGAEVEKRIQVLGMPIVRLKVGDVSLALSPKKDAETVTGNPDEPRWGAYQVGFKVPDMAQAIAEIEARGGVFTGKNVEVVPGVLASFLRAPDGVEIELLALA